MTDKNPQEAKIKKGLSPRRDVTSFQTQHDITIPAGTILRSIGDDEFAAAAAHGTFSIHVEPGSTVPPLFRRVVAS